MLSKIDDYLNNITMYRLLAYGLGILSALGLGYSLSGNLTLAFPALLASLIILLASCYVTNRVIANMWGAPTNSESWLITALILFLILAPATNAKHGLALLLAGILAMASKYILARQRKHLFNPAALAAVVVGLFGLTFASWWVGNASMWPFVLILGLLVVRKTRRAELFLSFFVISAVLAIVSAIMQSRGLESAFSLIFISSPLIFLGTIMLTEPSTTPPLRNQQIIYGGLVGLLYGLNLQIFGQHVYPETALILGNVYAYAVSPKYKLRLRLKRVEKMSERVYNFVFVPDRKPLYLPGQYFEWTLPHDKYDGRGNRRTFTIASSPTESEVQLGVKFYEPSSSYKLALKSMKLGDSIYAGQLAGNFILPKDQSKKLVFIAGGIGITPFRSMLKYLIDSNEKRDITLFYLVSSPDEVSYKEVLEEAKRVGVTIITVLGSDTPSPEWKGLTGRLDAKMLTTHVVDYAERSFYLSGPHAMTEGYKKMLTDMGVQRRNMTVDYFSGY